MIANYQIRYTVGDATRETTVTGDSPAHALDRFAEIIGSDPAVDCSSARVVGSVILSETAG